MVGLRKFRSQPVGLGSAGDLGAQGVLNLGQCVVAGAAQGGVKHRFARGHAVGPHAASTRSTRRHAGAVSIVAE